MLDFSVEFRKILNASGQAAENVKYRAPQEPLASKSNYIILKE